MADVILQLRPGLFSDDLDILRRLLDPAALPAAALRRLVAPEIGQHVLAAVRVQAAGQCDRFGGRLRGRPAFGGLRGEHEHRAERRHRRCGESYLHLASSWRTGRAGEADRITFRLECCAGLLVRVQACARAGSPYSALSAAIGSARVARHAGPRHATMPPSTNIAPTAANVAGSV